MKSLYQFSLTILITSLTTLGMAQSSMSSKQQLLLSKYSNINQVYQGCENLCQKGPSATCALSFSKDQIQGIGADKCVATCLSEVSYQANLSQRELVKYMHKMTSIATTPQACCANKWQAVPVAVRNRVRSIAKVAVTFVQDPAKKQAILNKLAPLIIIASGSQQCVAQFETQKNHVMHEIRDENQKFQAKINATEATMTPRAQAPHHPSSKPQARTHHHSRHSQHVTHHHAVPKHTPTQTSSSKA